MLSVAHGDVVSRGSERMHVTSGTRSRHRCSEDGFMYLQIILRLLGQRSSDQRPLRSDMEGDGRGRRTIVALS